VVWRAQEGEDEDGLGMEAPVGGGGLGGSCSSRGAGGESVWRECQVPYRLFFVAEEWHGRILILMVDDWTALSRPAQRNAQQQ